MSTHLDPVMMPFRWHSSHSILLATRMAVEIVTTSDPEAKSRTRTNFEHTNIFSCSSFRANPALPQT